MSTLRVIVASLKRRTKTNMKHSYIITSKETGKAVTEIFSKDLADKVKTDKYRGRTAMDYLSELNASIKSAA